jgi:hypothetical protein
VRRLSGVTSWIFHSTFWPSVVGTPLMIDADGLVCCLNMIRAESSLSVVTASLGERGSAVRAGFLPEMHRPNC